MIIGSDFDGTIYIDYELKDEDLACIKDFQKSGHKFGIVTGRSFHSLYKIIKAKIDPDFYIANNGGHVLVKEKDGLKEILKLNIGKNLATSFFDYYKKNYSYDLAVFTEDKKHRDLSSIKSDIMALAIYTDDWIDNHFEGELDFHHSLGVIDVVKKGVDKNKGIELIKDYYGYKKDIYAIGDDYNDIGFLKATPLSFTLDYVKNKDVIEATNYRVGSIKDLILKILGE